VSNHRNTSVAHKELEYKTEKRKAP